MSKMAADPEIQKELQEIEHEFFATEQNGLSVVLGLNIVPSIVLGLNIAPKIIQTGFLLQ